MFFLNTGLDCKSFLIFFCGNGKRKCRVWCFEYCDLFWLRKKTKIWDIRWSIYVAQAHLFRGSSWLCSHCFINGAVSSGNQIPFSVIWPAAASKGLSSHSLGLSFWSKTWSLITKLSTLFLTFEVGCCTRLVENQLMRCCSEAKNGKVRLVWIKQIVTVIIISLDNCGNSWGKLRSMEIVGRTIRILGMVHFSKISTTMPILHCGNL